MRLEGEVLVLHTGFLIGFIYLLIHILFMLFYFVYFQLILMRLKHQYLLKNNNHLKGN